jgi:hypothetical protein
MFKNRQIFDNVLPIKSSEYSFDIIRRNILTRVFNEKDVEK